MKISNRRIIKSLIFILIPVLIVLGISATVYTHHATQDWVTVTIWEKDRECTSSTDADGNSTTNCRYMVHTDSESFTNTDSLLAWKFNSTDVQRNLRPEQTYRVLVVGYRVGWLSMYRNIIDYRNLTEDEISDLEDKEWQ